MNIQKILALAYCLIFGCIMNIQGAATISRAQEIPKNNCIQLSLGLRTKFLQQLRSDHPQLTDAEILYRIYRQRRQQIALLVNNPRTGFRFPPGIATTIICGYLFSNDTEQIIDITQKTQEVRGTNHEWMPRQNNIPSYVTRLELRKRSSDARLILYLKATYPNMTEQSVSRIFHWIDEPTTAHDFFRAHHPFRAIEGCLEALLVSTTRFQRHLIELRAIPRNDPLPEGEMVNDPEETLPEHRPGNNCLIAHISDTQTMPAWVANPEKTEVRYATLETADLRWLIPEIDTEAKEQAERQKEEERVAKVAKEEQEQKNKDAAVEEQRKLNEEHKAQADLQRQKELESARISEQKAAIEAKVRADRKASFTYKLWNNRWFKPTIVAVAVAAGIACVLKYKNYRADK